ncbi:response regulator [Cesiribacter sp. SM1]|uniref:response regulator n=1 Tax=Cesiribacter sp. SM1 TaxID=2861196 RepID=UPI001CD4B046|nr:response regulator [Cesiribacter sp. SM1]
MSILKKILIIDDDETTCYLNKIFLEEMQVTEDVECLLNADEAFTYLKNLCSGGSYDESGPDLILLDINMPIMNGFELLEKVKQLERVGELCAQRIIMYTSSIHPRDVERANKLGVLAYVQKPLTEHKLKSVMEAYHKQAS